MQCFTLQSMGCTNYIFPIYATQNAQMHMKSIVQSIAGVFEHAYRKLMVCKMGIYTLQSMTHTRHKFPYTCSNMPAINYIACYVVGHKMDICGTVS